MDRREFLKTTGGVAAAAASATVAVAGEAKEVNTIAAPAICAGTSELTLAMPWPDNGKGFGDSARRLARRIERMSRGAYRIDLAAESSGRDAELLHGSAHDYLTVHPAFAYFAGLPGRTGLAAHDLAAWLSIGGGQDLWDDLAALQGLKSLLSGHSGASPALWTRQQVRGLEDFAGARVFAVGLGAEVVRALGGEAVAAPPAGLNEALSEGSVRFVEWGGLVQSLALDLHTAATHAVGDGLSGQGTALCLSIRLPVWESMSEAERSLFAAAAAEEFRVVLAEGRAHEAIVRRAMVEGHGVRFTPFPADVADAVARIADAVVAHTAGRDVRSARINRSYMEFKSAIGDPETPHWLTS